MEPLVSVIIPTYNRKHFVQLAIDSVLNQIYKNFELIVIDDGSTDGTESILREKYQDRIIYLWQPNQGESVARNKGLSIAQGEYIAFLDSDDLWCPEKLKIQVAALENPRNSKAVLAFSSAWMIDQEGNKITKSPVGRKRFRIDINKNILAKGPGIHGPASNILVKQNIITKIGYFDKNIRYAEDWDFIIRTRSKGSFIYLDYPLWSYRVHPNSQQGIPRAEQLASYLKDTLQIIDKNSNFLFNTDERKYRNTQAHIYIKVAAWCFVREQWEMGLNCVQRAKELLQGQLDITDIASRIGYWEAVVLLRQSQSPVVAENYFINVYLPALKNAWVEELEKLPYGLLSGTFYKYLVVNTPKNEKTLLRNMIGNTIKAYPTFLLSPSIIKNLILSIVRT